MHFAPHPEPTSTCSPLEIKWTWQNNLSLKLSLAFSFRSFVSFSYSLAMIKPSPCARCSRCMILLAACPRSRPNWFDKDSCKLMVTNVLTLAHDPSASARLRTLSLILDALDSYAPYCSMLRWCSNSSSLMVVPGSSPRSSASAPARLPRDGGFQSHETVASRDYAMIICCTIGSYMGYLLREMSSIGRPEGTSSS